MVTLCILPLSTQYFDIRDSMRVSWTHLKHWWEHIKKQITAVSSIEMIGDHKYRKNTGQSPVRAFLSARQRCLHDWNNNFTPCQSSDWNQVYLWIITLWSVKCCWCSMRFSHFNWMTDKLGWMHCSTSSFFNAIYSNMKKYGDFI